MDPGRKAIETREWEWLAVGDVFMTEHGVQFEVREIGEAADEHLTLWVRPVHRAAQHLDVRIGTTRPRTHEVRCRTVMGPTH